MTPSSRIVAGAAFATVFGLIISSMPAFAGAPSGPVSGAGHSVSGDASASGGRGTIRLGAPTAAPMLGAARRHHDRRYFARRYYGPDVPFVYGGYGGPGHADAATSPDGSQAYNYDDWAPGHGACAHPRVIQLAPVSATTRALPTVIYGSRPDCDPRRFSRGPITAPD